MSGEELKRIAASLPLELQTPHGCLQRLVGEGVFDEPVSSEDVSRFATERCGRSIKTIHVQTYMKRFMDAGVIQAVKPAGMRQNFWTLASVDRKEALRRLGKTQKSKQVEHELFSDELVSKLNKDFHRELAELKDNFGRNGNSTAFLLRKILEKLLIIVFGKHSNENLLKDPARPGNWKGLEDMVETAARERHSGIPFLLPRTAREIQGIKFLGDTAAHNPLANVDTETILPQMPFIITAYSELAERL
jgi:hypothetical protein